MVRLQQACHDARIARESIGETIGRMESHTKAAAEALLISIKGIARAHVDVDKAGRVARVYLVPDGIDDRAAMRNAQSALMAVLGQSVDVNAMSIGLPMVQAPVVAVPAEPLHIAAHDPDVVELKTGAHRNELHEAARVAFDTLRAAQSSFHGFGFDGAELVRIGVHQYVVVAVRRASTDARYCGAAPVIDSVATESARALMNAVGVAAMGATHLELGDASIVYEQLKA